MPFTRVARETLEGHLRGQLARCRPEEIKRLAFIQKLPEVIAEDANKLGLVYDRIELLSARRVAV